MGLYRKNLANFLTTGAKKKEKKKRKKQKEKKRKEKHVERERKGKGSLSKILPLRIKHLATL